MQQDEVDEPQDIIPSAVEGSNVEVNENQFVRQQDLQAKEDLETQSQLSDNEIKSTLTNEEEKEVTAMAADIGDVSGTKVKDLAESKYRVVNRCRPGSSISISKKIYHELMEGKSISYVNSREGSPMVIKLAKVVDDDLKKQSTNHDVQMAESPSVYQPLTEEESSRMESRVQSNEASVVEDTVIHKQSKEGNETRKPEEKGHLTKFGCDSDAFRFNSGTSSKRTHSSKKEARQRLNEPPYKAKSTSKKNISSVSPYSVLCRNYVGKKRKLVHHDLQPNLRPRKQHVVESSCSIKF